jgi:hypothetical protein
MEVRSNQGNYLVMETEVAKSNATVRKISLVGSTLRQLEILFVRTIVEEDYSSHIA